MNPIASVPAPGPAGRRLAWLQARLRTQLGRNMMSGAVTTALGGVVMLVSYPLYLRFMGYEDYGLWLLLSTVVSMVQFGNIGISHATTKLVAEEVGRGRVDRVEAYSATASAILILVGVVAIAVVLPMGHLVAGWLGLDPARHGEFVRFLPWVLLLSAYVLMLQADLGVLGGLGRMDVANYASLAARVVTLAVSVALLAAGLRLEALLIGAIAGNVVTHAVALGYARFRHGIRLFRPARIGKEPARALLRFGAGVFGGSVLNVLIHPLNKLFVSRFVGVGSVPVYEIAFTGGMQVRAVLDAGLRALMPEISRLTTAVGAGTSSAIRRVHRKANLLVILAALPVYGGFILVADPLLHVWLRSRLMDGQVAAFRLMLFGAFLGQLGVPAYFTFLGVGRVREVFQSHAVQSAINVLGLLIIAVALPAVTVPAIVGCVAISFLSSSVYLAWRQTSVLAEELAPGAAA